MRELVYYVAVSLDGYIATPDGSFTSFSTEGDHMQFYIEHFSDALPTHVLDSLQLTAPLDRFDTVIQGRCSYDIARSVGIDRPYAHLKEYVATRSNEVAPAGVTFTANALKTVKELKQQQGNDIYLCGGGMLASELLSEIDRLILKRYPIVLGTGIKLFETTKPVVANFKWVSCRSFDSGVVIEEYVRS